MNKADDYENWICGDKIKFPFKQDVELKQPEVVSHFDRTQQDQDREESHDCDRSCGCQDIKIYE